MTREGSNRELFLVGKDKLLPSMTVFLMHEVTRFNKLLDVIRLSCEKVTRVVAGTEVMSEETEDICTCIDFN